MRIGMMADAYKPHVSGITNYISINKHSLEAAGHEVFVFTFGGDDYTDEESNIIRTKGLPIVDTGLYISVRFSTQAQKILRTMDLVHVHHPFSSGRLAIRYCKPQGIPIIFTNHTRYDLYAHAYLPVVPEALGETFLRAYLPPFCRSCDLVIAPSAGLREVLIHLGVDAPIEVIPNGVDIAPFRNPETKIPREQLGFNPDEVILTYMGRLGPEKNLSLMMRAFAGLAKTYNQVKLMVIGDGPEKHNLIDQAHYLGIADRVLFTGMIPYLELPSYLAVADAFVTASITEVHPLSVIEAMAAGLPVVGIHSPGISDTVEDGVTGLLSPEVDLAVYTAKMTRMVVDVEGRVKMSKQAQEAVQVYSIDQTTANILTYYQQLVEKTSGRKRSLWSRWTRRVVKESP
jgi:glycosyltransferase involved in cell wall biosynthesis